MATILGNESSPSLRHRPRQRTLAGIYHAISYAINSPAQPMRIHSNLEKDTGYDSRTVILKDINAMQAFDDIACSRIVINLQGSKRETYGKAAVNILYTLGEIDAPLQASSGYSMKRYVRDHQTAYFLQKHPLWLTPLYDESVEVNSMATTTSAAELQRLGLNFEDQFRIIESSDIDFIRRVAGQIAIRGH